MKPVAIQKAVNVIKMDSWTSPVDFRYQNETSEFKVECDRVAAHKRGEVYTPKPWETLSYLAKEDLGMIHVRGFLHDRVAQNPDGSFTHPGSLSTDEIIRRLAPAWKAHAKKCRATEISHHRLVFSLSHEFHDRLVQAGRNPDAVLKSIIERTMRGFQENFHSGDSLGYSYGLHHDTDNLHAHVFIHPRTREGAFVGMSGKPKKHQQHASRHKDQLGYIRENVRRRVGQVLKELSNPKEAAELKKNLHSDRAWFVPRQSHTARPKNDFRPRSPADFELERKRASVVAIDRQIMGKRASLREAGDGRNIAHLFHLREPKWLRLMKKAQTATLFRELRELQERRYRLVAEYRAARRRLIPRPLATRTVPPVKRSKISTPLVNRPKPKPTVVRTTPRKPMGVQHGI
jgi:hypothetical protein